MVICLHRRKGMEKKMERKTGKEVKPGRSGAASPVDHGCPRRNGGDGYYC
jgi:hypothetical protein